MRKIVSCLLLSLLLARPAPALNGGEIGNAFVPFESGIGRYRLEYPKSWNHSDLSQLTSFYDPESELSKPNFLSVLTENMKGIATEADLFRYLRFFRPEVRWERADFAGLKGYRGLVEGSQLLYLLRGPEDLVSVRYRASEGSKSEDNVRHMLNSFQLF